MAMEKSTAAPALPLPHPPRLSASSPSPATVGALLTKAAASGASRERECRSPRSLLSRILHRRSGAGAGFGCRLRLPRYCSTGAAKKDAAEGAAKDEARGPAAPKLVCRQAEVRESPRSSHGKKEVSPANLGLGASLVLLLSKSAAELRRMAELRAQMERLLQDAKAEARSSVRSDASDQTDSASVVKDSIVSAGDEDAFSCHGPRAASSVCGAVARGDDGSRAATAMDRMEAELEAELALLQLASNNDEHADPRRDHQLEAEVKSDVSWESASPTQVDGTRECDEDEDSVDEEEGDDDEEEEAGLPHGGVPARELERRLHELLQSRHEERIAELESALERAQRKLQEKEREMCRWRDTAKLVSRHKDESRLR